MAAKDAPRSVASQLRDLLGKATEADVKEMDAEIEEQEKRLTALKANRKLLAQAVGIEEPKKQHWTQKRKAVEGTDATKTKTTADPRYSAADLTDRRKIVLKHLRAVGGSCNLDTLSAATRIARQGPGNLASVLAHEWFHVSPENIASITDKGDRIHL